jgi:hypothetical protein
LPTLRLDDGEITGWRMADTNSNRMR